jgi:3-dehydroquinate synthase
VALVHDVALAGSHAAAAREALRSAGYRVAGIPVPTGEASKSIAGIAALWAALAAAGLDRSALVVAVGGGVVGDLAGFAAATFLRGVRLVQVPTTLLAQVDSSVGGKTGIDLPAGKNLVGAFHQPRLVAADLATLATLPAAELRSGLAEVVKYGMIAEPALLDYLEANHRAVLRHEPEMLAHLVERSCAIKAAVVGEDEREAGRRAILNYGHTVGHAIEAVAGYGAYRHGEAVAIGMAAAGWLSVRHHGLPEADRRRVEALLRALELPVRLRAPLPAEALLEAMLHDKKAAAGELRFVLAAAPGRVEVRPLPRAEAEAAVAFVQPPHPPV